MNVPNAITLARLGAVPIVIWLILVGDLKIAFWVFLVAALSDAIDGIIDYIVTTYGYTRNQAYVIASVAVDLRISQLVDSPNVGVTAVLPLDIFNN